MDLESLDEKALGSLADKVAGVLEPGEVVVLAGEVGVGKTSFVRAAARSLGVAERVTSPTYQLARSYEGRDVTVNHLDLYRLEGITSADALELEDYLDPEAVTFIEWAEPALEALENPSVVEISHQTPTTRRARLSGPITLRLPKC